ncbi:MAG: hypothetical protein S4CHLAM37_16050 [Chlamydiia bacterium]|nr:hypothetical protein [Chlamydiia bacterium]
MVQHLPESIDRDGLDISPYIQTWISGSKANAVDPIRLLFLLSNVQHLKDVEGAFAEVGVYKGHTAKIFSSLFPERKFYLFDTFEGFEKSDFESETEKGSSSDNFDDTSLQAVKDYLEPNENLIFCKGYFPDTAKHVDEGEKFALVHLDADLYNPIKAGLEYFYPRMQHHGIIIVHDYSSGAWPGVTKAVDEFMFDKLEGIIKIPDKSGSVVIKRCINEKE